MSKIKLALPKGRLGEETLEVLKKSGFDTEGIKTSSRTLMFEKDDVLYLICKPSDVPIYVEKGVADIGIVGKDTILEEGRNVFELLDLGYGKCHFSMAIQKSDYEALNLKEGDDFPLYKFNHKRVGTKFVNITKEFFGNMGMQMEIIKLHGNIELAPKVNMVDAIVDIVSTGTTLRENNLLEVVEILDASATFITNPVSFRMYNDRINSIIEEIKKNI